MPLSGSALASARKSAIMGIPGITITDEAELTAFLEADSGAIVDHITGNALVNPGIAVTVSTGSGIGATTAPGTVS